MNHHARQQLSKRVDDCVATPCFPELICAFVCCEDDALRFAIIFIICFSVENYSLCVSIELLETVSLSYVLFDFRCLFWLVLLNLICVALPIECLIYVHFWFYSTAMWCTKTKLSLVRLRWSMRKCPLTPEAQFGDVRKCLSLEQSCLTLFQLQKIIWGLLKWF